jgi:hypothetical protein
MAVPICHDRCPRTRKGCTPRGEANIHTGQRIQPIGMKDVPISRSRTPIGPHGYRQAVTRIYPLAWRPVPMRPDGHCQTGTRKYPFAGCRHPWALMVPGKGQEGCLPQGKGLWPSGRIDYGKSGEGRTAPRIARGHAPSSTRRSAGGLQSCTQKAAALGLLDTVIDRESCTRSPRCATRFARWASGSAVKARPVSREGEGLQGKGPARARSATHRREENVTSSPRVTPWARSRKL